MTPPDARPTDPLRQRWHDLWRRSNASGDPQPGLDDLIRRYREPGRHYHSLAHVEYCLRELDAATGLTAHPEAVEVALWFHDAVYDPHRHDNEQASADLATAALSGLGISGPEIARVVDLILSTRHNQVPIDPDAALVVDIDLAILGADPATFDAYEGAIRSEYAHVPDDAFRASRTRVLESFLARPTIYTTTHFRDRYERLARQNLARSITQLSAIA